MLQANISKSKVFYPPIMKKKATLKKKISCKENLLMNKNIEAHEKSIFPLEKV